MVKRSWGFLVLHDDIFEENCCGALCLHFLVTIARKIIQSERSYNTVTVEIHFSDSIWCSFLRFFFKPCRSEKKCAQEVHNWFLFCAFFLKKQYRMGKTVLRRCPTGFFFYTLWWTKSEKDGGDLRQT